MRNFKAYSPGNTRRRGLASVLAMLYLVLFSTLAVGFYAATTLSAQVAKNERSLTTAQSAAESGMEFMRYQLGVITVPPGTPSNLLLTTVYGLLGTNLNGTSNMGTDVVTMANDANGNPTIYVPGNTSHFISLDSTSSVNTTGAKFQGTIAQLGDKLVVTVTGMGSNGTISRGVQLSYQKAARASAIFNYGVASKGKITTGGASYIIGNPDPAMGSVLSTDMVDSVPVAIGGKQVSGDISITNPSGSVSYSGASIGGTSDPTQIPQHIHIGVQSPTFPTIDSSVYTNAVTMNAYSSGSRSLSNVYIPPNTNPSFAGNTTVMGVLWIQSPNVVSFTGNLTITGVIVVDNNTTFNAAKNQINFGGSVRASGVQNLPNTATYTNLRSLTGAFLLAPGYAVNFSGDFGSVAGSIIASQISMTGNATGTVQGSVIGVDNQPLTLNGSADITIASTGTSNYPAGVSFGSYYTPLPDTYVEIEP